MKKNRLYLVCWVLMIHMVGLTSCIRDEILPCPPLQVMIDIEDKNYDNIDFIEEKTGLDFRKDESMSFRSYIQSCFMRSMIWKPVRLFLLAIYTM